MNTVRGLTVWLVAPILASLICTAGWQFLVGGMDWRPIAGIGVMSLMFTLGGSTLLSLVFAGMQARSVTTRYGVLVGLGAAAGGAWMMMIGGSQVGVTAGVVYGTVTACLWVGLHRTLFGSR